ncbi:hypothetical protein F5Y07DRAFT_342168 [Xylaria sp. FL0933]|nr:hypothetical protein F5Y07DRAFT_342168 [Xylaria sp. FL0933]
MLALCIWISLILPYVWGNTEKTIFLGPSPVDLDSKQYYASDLSRLASLNPDNFTIRTHLKAEHPGSDIRPRMTSWLVLHNLTEGQRYEVRVCWAATQPAAFRLETYEIEAIMRAPELTSELSEYASMPQSNMEIPFQTFQPAIEESMLLLRIIAVADFYTTNHTLMKNAPSVTVDVILDPFILNILPQSLLPTVIYTIAVAIVSWFVGKWISVWVRQLAAEPTKQKYQ